MADTTTTTTTTRAYTPSSGMDFSVSPYFDRFKATDNRTRLLFLPDAYLQNSELNEMQSIFSYYLGELGNIVASDGDMQDGMSYTQDGNKITVHAGKVYLAGKVRSFAEQTVTIQGTGMEYVGVKLTQRVITATDDATLNDPVIGVPSADSAGANRLVEDVQLVANDTSAATIYQFANGTLYTQAITSELSKITDIMARRSYETDGNYRVGDDAKQTGFELSLVKNTSDPTNKIDLVIQPGLAFVQGYEVKKPYATTLTLDKALDTETITGEQHIYHPASSTYSLNFPNVKSITSVSAQVQRIFPINHAANDGTDEITDNLISVDKVYTEGAQAHTYVQGTDYVVKENGVSWAPATGQEPAVNTTYLVLATFNQTLKGGGVDYTLTQTNNGLTATIDFANASGSNGTGAYTPKDGGYITVTYDTYLYRVDLVTLDKNGTFTVHKGQPDREQIAMAPSLNDPLTLTIGTVTIFPNADTGLTNTTAVTNLTMEKLNKLLNRVTNIEYNEVINALDNQTIQEHTPSVLRGIFTDMFVTMDKYDESYDNTSTASTGNGFTSNVMFSFDDGRITLPKDAEDPYQAQIIGDSSTAHVWGRLVSAPFTETPIVQQLKATDFTLVNPYNFFQKEGVLEITPSADNWIDTKNVTVYNTQTVSYNTGRWWKHVGHDVSGGAQQAYYNANTNWGGKDNGWADTLTGSLTSSGGTTTTDEQIQYMRPQTIAFAATGLSPQDDNLVMRFNGIRCPITVAKGYNKGSSETGSIMADSNGTAAGTFDIPENVKCGKVPVVLQGVKSAAQTSYVAEGINRTVTDTVITTYVTAHFTDPLAQSFQTLDARQITGVNLYFGSKSATSTVTVQVRGMSDTGMPNTTVYATAILNPADVNISNDASAVTKVRFDDPLMTKAGDMYAIVIISDSNEYTVATATMGQNLIGTDEMLNGQPYLTGVMFTSSNGDTWSPSQMSDLKFEVIAASYNSSATMEFQPFTNMKLDEFILFATYLTPDNTGCVWEYRLLLSSDTGSLDGKAWQPLANFDLTDAEGTAKEVQLRATFAANEYISPLMSLDDLQFGAFTTALRGDYVGINMDCSDSPYNTITLGYEEQIIGQSSVVPEFSIDGGRSWNAFTSNPTTATVSTDWQSVKYVEKLTTQVSDELEASSDPTVVTPGTGGDSTGTILAKNFKIHFKLATPNPYQRPSVRKLSAACTDE